MGSQSADEKFLEEIADGRTSQANQSIFDGNDFTGAGEVAAGKKNPP
jgi:hypothetical protein